MAKLREIAQSAIKEWQDEHGEAEIRAEINHMLDNTLQVMVAHAIGVERDSFDRGGWRVAPYGTTGKWIDEMAKDAVRQYLSEHIAAELPALTESIKAEIRKEYKEAVLDFVKDTVRDDVRDIVTQVMDETITEETQKFDFDDLEIAGQVDEDEADNLWAKS